VLPSLSTAGTAEAAARAHHTPLLLHIHTSRPAMASVVEAPPAKKDQEAAESRGYPTPRTSRAATSLGMAILLTGADI
jgi:hypothetical protein